MTGNSQAPREVLFLLDSEGRILWTDASDSPVALPDSRERWEAIWGLRAQLHELAHSHPVGPLGFSEEDESTMEALAVALGRAPVFSVVAPDGMVRRQAGATSRVTEEPAWADELRARSGMSVRTPQVPAVTQSKDNTDSSPKPEKE